MPTNSNLPGWDAGSVRRHPVRTALAVLGAALLIVLSVVSKGAVPLSLAVLAVILGAYWAPSIVGKVRHVPNLGSVVTINLFAGWTLIGWVVALAMAARTVPLAAPGTPGSTS
jgi:Superinfection immunity protein